MCKDIEPKRDGNLLKNQKEEKKSGVLFAFTQAPRKCI